MVVQLFFLAVRFFFRKDDSGWNTLPSLPIFNVRNQRSANALAIPLAIQISNAESHAPQNYSMRAAALEAHPDAPGANLRTAMLKSSVESALARSIYLSGRNLRFEMHGDGVVLRGTVRSYYHKQLAQESLKAISGIPRIHNEIEVVASQ